MNPASTFCYPQLSPLAAVERWNDLRTETLSGLTNAMEQVDTTGAEYYPTAQRRADNDLLQELRSEVVKIATRHGFPAQLSRRLTDFDREVGPVIYELMKIIPADAASVEVWNFVNLRVLLDIVAWRWGTWSDAEGRWKVSEDRLFQFQRTAFGRLWWRVHLLGPIAGRLGEDQVVQLIERPRIAGYRPLAQSLAARHLADRSGVKQEDLLRVVMKRIGRRLAVQNVFVMSPEQLHGFVDEVFNESAEALKRS